MFLFAAMGIFVKSAGRQVPFFEIVMFRCLVSAVAIVLLAKKEKVPLKGNRRGLLLMRGTIGTVSLFMYFYAMMHISVANTILLNQTAPVFVLPIAAILLKEKITLRQTAAAFLAMAGVALVVKPDGNMINIPAMLALLSAVFSAFVYVFIRELAKTEHPLTIVYWFNLVGFLVALPFTLPNLVIPSLRTALDLFVMALLATAGQIFMTFAYRKTEASRLAVVGSFGALFGALFDWLVWNHLPDAASALGGVIIILSCVLIQLKPGEKKALGSESLPLS
jgi:drug/metabolite transporter (DMT)-like permease